MRGKPVSVLQTYDSSVDLLSARLESALLHLDDIEANLTRALDA